MIRTFSNAGSLRDAIHKGVRPFAAHTHARTHTHTHHTHNTHTHTHTHTQHTHTTHTHTTHTQHTHIHTHKDARNKQTNKSKLIKHKQQIPIVPHPSSLVPLGQTKDELPQQVRCPPRSSSPTEIHSPICPSDLGGQSCPRLCFLIFFSFLFLSFPSSSSSFPFLSFPFLSFPLCCGYSDTGQCGQALKFLKLKRVPHLHLHTSNVMLYNNNVFLSDIENSLLGTNTKNKLTKGQQTTNQEKPNKNNPKNQQTDDTKDFIFKNQRRMMASNLFRQV